MIGRDLDGEKVLTAAAAIPRMDWYVFVEQPLSKAYRGLGDLVAPARRVLRPGPRRSASRREWCSRGG